MCQKLILKSLEYKFEKFIPDWKKYIFVKLRCLINCDKKIESINVMIVKQKLITFLMNFSIFISNFFFLFFETDRFYLIFEAVLQKVLFIKKRLMMIFPNHGLYFWCLRLLTSGILKNI